VNDNDKKLKTGSDPRTLPDYAALRDELAKLSHPARPDVDWQHVEQLSLSLFRQNGIELQTLTWYTLARTRLAGISGLNEGLALLEALLTHQWATLWPQPVHARMEILSGFSQRLQAALRALTLHYTDLPLVYQAERHLAALRDVLQRMELKNASKVGELCTFMHNAATRLENVDGVSQDNAPIVLPAISAITAHTEAQTAPKPLVYVVREEPAAPHIVPERVVPDKKPQPWFGFAAGMLTMLLIGAAGLWGWQRIYPVETGPLPAIANEASLSELGKLSPLWLQNYGFTLAASATPAQSEHLKVQWQQYISDNALSQEALSGWHQGMAGLQDLTQRLNALDERKGKYLTGSELKSMVFAITQNFSRTKPVEEQLYLLSQIEAGTRLPTGQVLQLEMQINQLLNRYSLIKQQIESL